MEDIQSSFKNDMWCVKDQHIAITTITGIEDTTEPAEPRSFATDTFMAIIRMNHI
jgi:hypothetical protein